MKFAPKEKKTDLEGVEKILDIIIVCGPYSTKRDIQYINGIKI